MSLSRFTAKRRPDRNDNSRNDRSYSALWTHMLEILIYGFLIGVLLIGSFQHDRQRKAHERAMAAVKASLPKMAEAIAEAKFEQHRILQRLMAQGGITSVSLQKRVVHVQRKGTITLNCRAGSQLMWMRWDFASGEHELLDFWQLGQDRNVVLTTQKSTIPAWAAGDTPSCIKKSAALWRISTGDRIAYVHSWKFEGDGGEIVNIYEADEDAVVAFSQEVAEPQLVYIDNSPEAVERARAAFAAAKRFGPPRSMSVDADRWDLGT